VIQKSKLLRFYHSIIKLLTNFQKFSHWHTKAKINNPTTSQLCHYLTSLCNVCLLNSAVRIFKIASRIVTSVFDSIRNERNYSKFSNTYRHQFLTCLTEWRRFFTLATTPSNQQNLLLTMVQVLYLLEVLILAHYGSPSTETPITEINHNSAVP